jgi:putative transposase
MIFTIPIVPAMPGRPIPMYKGDRKGCPYEGLFLMLTGSIIEPEIFFLKPITYSFSTDQELKLKMKNKQRQLDRYSNRLKEYDYSKEGLYFITICTHERKCHFGYIYNHEMILNPIGMIAREQWQLLPKRFTNIEPGPFIIMPNHIHGIIIAGARATDSNDTRATAKVAPTTTDHPIGNIVGAYKSLVVHHCMIYGNQTGIVSGKIWQRNYFDHIIRNEQSYRHISEYILSNPANWDEDRFK